MSNMKQKMINKTQFRDYDVRGDGNCLFRAMALALLGNEEKHNEIRQEVVNWLEIHSEELENECS